MKVALCPSCVETGFWREQQQRRGAGLAFDTRRLPQPQTPLDSNTLTLYLVAGGFSLSLCLMLLVMAYLQPGTRLLNPLALGIFLFSLGFTVSGLGPMLPRWGQAWWTGASLLQVRLLAPVPRVVPTPGS